MDIFYICHFEDEPEKIDLPDLIEAGLYETRKFTKCEIVSQDQIHTISFGDSTRNFELRYIVRDKLDTMLAAIGMDGTAGVVATLLDMHLGANDNGVQILRTLRAQCWRSTCIWMLTAYPVEARMQLMTHGLDNKIISKPANLRLIRDEIIEIILQSIPSPAS